MSALTTGRKSLVVGVAALSLVGVGLAATGGTALAASGSTAKSAERHGACGNARYDAEVDRENRGLEASFEIDRAKRGDKWNIVMKHNGKTIYDATRTVDREGEIDVEKWRKNAPGVDTFVVTAKRVGGNGYCKVTLTR